MFKRLHIQMTVFSSVITGAILTVMALFCLFLSETSYNESSWQTFTNNARSCIMHLEQQPLVSHQWLRQSMNTYGVKIRVRDNGSPLYFEQLEDLTDFENAFEEAADISRESYQLDPDAASTNLTLTQTAEFSFLGYYACTALIPKDDGVLTLVILYPLSGLSAQIHEQRAAYGIAVLAAIVALILFSWFFTGRMIRPLEKSRREQTAFIAAASHELRSPLAVIRSGLSAVPEASPEKAGVFLDIALRECDRMALLISDMLTLSGADNHSLALNTAPCEPDTLLLETYEKYQPLAREAGLSLLIELPEDPLPRVSIDSAKIEQLLSILVDNALSYVPSGGQIRLSGAIENPEAAAAGPKTHRRSVAFTVRKESSVLVLTVSDNGPGIPDAEKKAIFRRFYRSDSSRTDKQHFGLGLSIAAEIARLHHGTLTVSDAPGGGAVFILKLPLC